MYRAKWYLPAVLLVIGGPGRLFSAARAQTPPEIRIASGVESGWAFPGADGAPRGFFVDVLQEAARREGLRTVWIFHGRGLESALADLQADLWAAASPTRTRKNLYYFSAPYWTYDYYLLMPATVGASPDAGSAGARRIVHTGSPPMDADWGKLFPGAVIEVEKPNDAAASRFCTGQSDAWLMTHPEWLEFSKNRPSACVGKPLRLVAVPEIAADLSVVSSFAKKALCERIRGRIEEMMTDGSLARIALRYPGISSVNALRISDAAGRRSRMEIERASRLFFAALVVLMLAGFTLILHGRRRYRRALSDAAQASSAKSAFLASMSHEIRTPLNALFGYIDLLLQTPLRADQRSLLRDTQHSASGLLSLLTDVLDFSRIESGHLAIRHVRFHPVAVFDDAVATSLIEAEAKNLETVIRIAPRVPDALLGDPGRLRQILVNLLSNAVKYTQRGFVRATLDYDPAGPGALLIEVADTGIGIAEDRRKAVFEPFVQSKNDPAVQADGIGLGLAIVAKLVEMLEGNIEMDSAVGVGTRFSLRIPFPRGEQARPWLEEYRQDGGVFLLYGKHDRNAEVFEYFGELGLEAAGISSAGELAPYLAQGRSSPALRGVLFLGMPEEPGELAARIRAATRGAPAGDALVDQPIVALLESLTVITQAPPSTMELFDRVLTRPLSGRSIPELFARVQPDGAGGNSHRQALVVDDNPINRRVQAAMLERLGCSVDTAPSGEDALDMMASKPYDLVLMDIQMPDMDGFETTRRIRNLNRLARGTRIIGVSAWPEEELLPKCLAAGMDGYSSKPVTLESLRRLVTDRSGV
jgi:signal transduction histidine kinase/CheY-like chemotaxis protein